MNAILWWLQQPRTVTQENWYWVWTGLAVAGLLYSFIKHEVVGK